MPRLPAYTLPACTARDLTCFFRPLSRCDSAVGARNREMKALNARSAAFVTQESTEAGKLVSLHQARNGRGTFRVFSELLAFLTRPIAKLASAIDAAHVSSGLAAAEREHDSPIVGLHIRRGDACGPGESERTVPDPPAARGKRGRLIISKSMIDSVSKYESRERRSAHCGWHTVHSHGGTDNREPRTTR